MWKDVKYLIAYLLPLTTLVGVYTGGKWAIAGFALAFVVLPLIELIIPPNPSNHDPDREMQRSKRLFFDILLYLNIVVVYGLITLLADRVASTQLTGYELTGMILSVGVVVGACGINVAHELGHRSHWFDRTISMLLLVPAFYTHFTTEHNFGHHKDVGTPHDPATARLGETVYAFWVRCISGTYRNAWRIQRRLSEQKGTSFWNPAHNDVLLGTLLQVVYLVAVFLVFGFFGGIAAVIAGVVGILLLESVNYIEHYGLMRSKMPSGRYEPVNPTHSWNSDYEMGRIFLYELTRHSDHHFKSTRKYQILRHMEEAPQLPLGYPGSIILALIPPLWMSIVNPRVNRATA